MKENLNNGLSRRKFFASSAALAAVSMVPVSFASAEPAESPKKVSSNFGGVHVGAITYSWRSMPGGLENIIKYCQECGISTVELMSGDLETYLGAPENPMTAIFRSMPPPPPPKPGEAPQRMRRPELTDEKKAGATPVKPEKRERNSEREHRCYSHK